MKFLHTYRIEIFIVLVAFLLRCLYLWASVVHNNGNLVGAIHGADGYFEVSKNLILGHGLTDSTQPPYTPYSFRPPLYHYSIYAAYSIFRSYWGVILLQVFAGSMIPILGMRIANFVTDRKKIVLGVGWFLAVEPVGVLFSTFVYSETLFTVLLLASLVYLLKFWKDAKTLHIVCAGVLLGLATLTRPTAEYVPVVAALLLLFEFRKHITKRLVLNLCVFMLAFLATLTPWLYRNYRTFGVVALTPQSEVALYAVYAPSVLAVANHTGFQEEYDKLQAQGVTGPNQTGFGQSDGYTQKAISIFKSHPKAFVLESLNTEISFFTHDGVLDVMRHIGADTGVRLGAPALFLLLKNPLAFAGVVVRLSVTPLGLVLVGRIFWVLTTLLFFFGAYQYWKRYGLTFPVTLSVLVVLYFAATTVLVGLTVNSRYRLPVSALIAMFAAYGLWSLYRWYKSRRAPRS